MPSLHPHPRPALAGFVLLVLGALAPQAGAQPTAADAAADRPKVDRALDPAAAVPPLVYRSVLQQPAPAPRSPMAWREANDQVHRIGGWQAYLREAAKARAAEKAQAQAQADSAPASPGTATPPAPAPAHHSPHSHH